MGITLVALATVGGGGLQKEPPPGLLPGFAAKSEPRGEQATPRNQQGQQVLWKERGSGPGGPARLGRKGRHEPPAEPTRPLGGDPSVPPLSETLVGRVRVLTSGCLAAVCTHGETESWDGEGLA